MQYENAENKPAVAAYAGGAVSAIIFAEWLIHKPGLNIVSFAATPAALIMRQQFCLSQILCLFLQLLGFPIQLFGLLLLPGAILKYLVEKESPADDVRGALV